MKVSDAYPSNYIAATDLDGNNVTVTMKNVDFEKVGEEQKPVLYFKGKTKGLILNKTNAKNIATVYGDDMDDWTGQDIVLFPAMVDFQGKTVEAIRIRAPQPKDRKKDSISTAPQREAADLNDDIPF